MLTTADGMEFSIGLPGWNQQAHEWRTYVEVRDGDKIWHMTVATPAAVKKEAVHGCVEKSMQQWTWPAMGKRDKALRGGV